MATTSSNLTAGKAMAGQSGNGNGSGKRVAGALATAVLGLGLLGGMVLGQARPATHPAVSGGAAPAFVADEFTYREDHRTLTGTLDWEQQERTVVAPGSFIPDSFTYREDYRGASLAGLAANGVATHGGGPADEYTQSESTAAIVANRNGLLADGTRPGLLALMPGETRLLPLIPDQFTYREDRRASSATAFISDQFTYREDHRGER
jgi:hypothetical protein